MSVSILIPTRDRKKFSPLISHNINIQDYDNIKEIIIYDDGFIKEILDLDVKYKINYHHHKEISIGEKRNKMVKKCKTKYAVFMDTDDIYLPSYVSHCVSLMSKNKKIVGTADMLFYFHEIDKFDYMSCLKTHLIHEATICCDVKWFNKNCKFHNSFAGEGQSLINVKDNIEESDIYKCMVCLCHKFNTVNKSKWNTKV